MTLCLFFQTMSAPETRCTAHTGGGVIRACVVARAIVRPACGAVAGMGLAAPMT
jgi:hypothetical protein